ncbi:MAG: glycosyltransferase family 2 protein [Bacteroidota bacterium]
MEKLIISIVTWNNAPTIYNCLLSVLNQSFSDFQLFIVDNNSADETRSIIESFSDSRIKFFKFNRNTGFCGGHNYSLQNSESEFALLVNPDIIMRPEYIKNALEVMMKNKQIGTVCGLLLQNDADGESFIDSAGMEMKRSRIMQLRFHGENIKNVVLKGEEEVFGADGALPLYRRAMIDDVSVNGQFFDEMFFAHKEDWDVSWRSSLFGWKAYFSPSCIAIHPRSFKPKSLKTRGAMSKEVKFHAVKNQLLLLIKNQSASGFVRNIFFIVPRQIMIFVYILFFEFSSLKSYAFVFRNLTSIMNSRNFIQRRHSIQVVNKK